MAIWGIKNEFEEEAALASCGTECGKWEARRQIF